MMQEQQQKISDKLQANNRAYTLSKNEGSNSQKNLFSNNNGIGGVGIKNDLAGHGINVQGSQNQSAVLNKKQDLTNLKQ
jgi:hypothetical protein